MNYLVTLATRGEQGWQDRTESLDRLATACRLQGLDTTTFVWTYARLQQTMLYKCYKSWFTRECSLGWWTWKPYILLMALAEIKDDDVLICLDSDLGLGGELSDFYPELEKSPALFIGHGFRNDKYCTGDCFHLMGCEDESYYAADHIWGAVIILKKCAKTVQFVFDWMVCCLNTEILLGQNKYVPNRPGFEATRYTQGILTNLVVRYGFTILNNSWAGKFNHPPFTLPFGG